MRRAIAAAMAQSAAIPQFTLERRVDATSMQARRLQLRTEGTRVSLQDLIVTACAGALREHPDVNSSFDEDAIVVHERINVGIAIAVDGGLLSPAIMDADRLTPAEVAEQRQTLQAGARAGKLPGKVLYGATFSVSNLGTFGVDRFRALVIPPQSAILAIGALCDDPRPELWLSLSCDHRVLDGAPAAEFLGEVVARLQDGARDGGNP
jgi:pyruvate dehydrogenase E2 component (dihydrolipoamide acetyltransferase)